MYACCIDELSSFIIHSFIYLFTYLFMYVFIEIFVQLINLFTTIYCFIYSFNDICHCYYRLLFQYFDILLLDIARYFFGVGFQAKDI